MLVQCWCSGGVVVVECWCSGGVVVMQCCSRGGAVVALQGSFRDGHELL